MLQYGFIILQNNPKSTLKQNQYFDTFHHRNRSSRQYAAGFQQKTDGKTRRFLFFIYFI